MKSLIFIAVLVLTEPTIACVFYPEGEEIRMRLLSIEMLGLDHYKPFEYSSSGFGYWDRDSHNDRTANLMSWSKYLNGAVDLASIENCVYGLKNNELYPGSSNKMVRYLYKTNDLETINYLRFAKLCEPLNYRETDTWGEVIPREEPKYMEMIKIGKWLMDRCENQFIQKRYVHLIIRLAHYDDKPLIVRFLFDSVFFNAEKDLVYYWSLYFRAFAEINHAKSNLMAGQVFANSPDKRMPIHRLYNREISTNDVMSFAQNDDEKANFLFMSATLSHEATLKSIRQASDLGLSQEKLLFLLCRETNKLEDWILTPAYTHLDDPIYREPQAWENLFQNTSQLFRLRIARDKKYAVELYEFTKSLEKSDELSIIQAHLLFLIDKFKESNNLVEELLKNKSINEHAVEGLKAIKLLNLIHLQDYKIPKLTHEIESLLLHFKNNKRVIFSAGRNFEFAGNSTDAAIIYSHVESHYDYDYSYSSGSMFWSPFDDDDNDFSYYSSVISDYFTYVDVVYSAPQTKKLFRRVDKASSRSEFDSWYYSNVKQDRDKLLDLLGTKYVRLDDLKNAKRAFAGVSHDYWKIAYGDWNEANYNWSKNFQQNPFYTLKYTDPFIHDAKPFYLSKYSIVSQLIDYLDMAKNPNEPNRDKYYLYIGNCYANMTASGNSWIMRRNYYSLEGFESFYPDEDDFRNNVKAKMYYQMAAENTSNQRFKALCYFLAKDKKQLQKLPREHQELKYYGCYILKDFYRSR